MFALLAVLPAACGGSAARSGSAPAAPAAHGRANPPNTLTASRPPTPTPPTPTRRGSNTPMASFGRERASTGSRSSARPTLPRDAAGRWHACRVRSSARNRPARRQALPADLARQHLPRLRRGHHGEAPRLPLPRRGVGADHRRAEALHVRRFGPHPYGRPRDFPARSARPSPTRDSPSTTSTSWSGSRVKSGPTSTPPSKSSSSTRLRASSRGGRPRGHPARIRTRPRNRRAQRHRLRRRGQSASS